jgi:hypothetical protein
MIKFLITLVLFVNTKTAGGGDYLSWEELKQIADEAIEIGNHSLFTYFQ